jgi:predicted nuclease with TOPRIM domain
LIDTVVMLVQPSGWTPSNTVAIAVAIVALIGTTVTGVIAGRASVKAGRMKLDYDERAADRTADLERRRLQDETILRLREHLEGIIARLTDEVNVARAETARLREQVNVEQGVSDALRARVRDLEDRIHEMSQAISKLRSQLIAEDADAILGIPASEEREL